MGALARFERKLGGFVEGTFTKVFRGKVEPVELAQALAKEADNNKAVGPQRVLVPNIYTVDLGASDYDRLEPYALTLGDELAAMLGEHASQQGYSFIGPVIVRLVYAADLGVGRHRITSRVEAGDGPPVAAHPAARSGTFAPALPSALPTPVPAPLPPVMGDLPMELPAPVGVLPAAADQTMVASTAYPTTALPRAEPPPFGRVQLPDGTSAPVGPGPTVIGRGSEADIRLADASVSRRHARISRSDGQVLVEDLGSTNGTSVNGRQTDRAPVADGDTITLGGATVVFRS